MFSNNPSTPRDATPLKVRAGLSLRALFGRDLRRVRVVALFAFVALTFGAGSFHGHDEIGDRLGSDVECVACQAVSLAPTETVPSGLTPFFTTIRLPKALIGRIPRAAASSDDALPRGPPQV